MDASELFSEKVMRACARQAKRVTVVNRRIVEYGDVLQEMYVWVGKHEKYVNEYVDTGQHGLNKLNVALYRAGHTFVALERARRTGCKPGDFYYYTPAVIEELLPDVWTYSGWESASGSSEPDMPRGKSKPSEGGNRRAMMIDVAYAVSTMPAEDQRALRERFTNPQLSNDQLGQAFDLTGDAYRKKVDRLLVKLVDRLGGEPPYWPAGRRAQSNAAAQSKLRNADG